jgi:hypothetical protein
MDGYASGVDVVFIHEVLYFISNLDESPEAIPRMLRSRGVYSAAIACHIGNPLWSCWRKLIRQSIRLPVVNYSLDDYARAIWQSGFRVDMRPYQINDYVLIKPNNPYFPSARDSLNHHDSMKAIIRATCIAGGR